MNRREFLTKLLLCGGALGIGEKLFETAGLKGSARQYANEQPGEYYRIVLLGDPHLPVRVREHPDSIKQQRILEAKNRAIRDINAWEDVRQIHVLGDIVAQFGNEEEYFFARQFFSELIKPVYYINGNHDYIYTDRFSPEGKFVIADTESRLQKLSRFRETFGLADLHYSLQLGGYLLVFLAVDSVDTPLLTSISVRQLQWFKELLAYNSEVPTIVFFHAPLAGTLESYNKQVNTPNFIAEPAITIANIIHENPQIFLWVSGHTHTPATNTSYMSAVNIFDKHVINIHNTDMDRETIWSNSLYLYAGKVIVKTYNHKEQKWEDHLERTIPV